VVVVLEASKIKQRWWQQQRPRLLQATMQLFLLLLLLLLLLQLYQQLYQHLKRMVKQRKKARLVVANLMVL
jgi:hypothetical protein